MDISNCQSHINPLYQHDDKQSSNNMHEEKRNYSQFGYVSQIDIDTRVDAKEQEDSRRKDIDDMFSIVGEYGTFQKIVNIMVCILIMPVTFQIIIIYFVGHTPNWKCSINSTHCIFNETFDKDDRRRCDIPRNEWQFTEPKDYSIITQFDISCEEEWVVSLSATIYFVGFIIGCLVLGWCTDNYGRTKTVFLSMAATLAVGLITAFMPTILYFTICRFIVGFFGPVIPMAFIMMYEMVGENKRSFSGILVLVFCAIAACLICAKAYFFRKWKLLYIICTVPYTVILFFYFFIPESVRFLRVKGRIEDAMAVFQRIAKWNKNTIPRNIVLSKPPLTTTNRKSSPIDLFRTRNLATKTLVQSYIWYAMGVIFFGLVYVADDLDGGLYLDFFLLNASEIPAIVAVMYLIECFGRKKPIMVTLLIGSVSCVVVAFIPKHGYMRIVRLTLGIIAKCLTTASYDALHMWSSEMYPSNIRGVGMGFVQFASRIGNASAPWIAKELKRLHPSVPFLLMGGLPFIGFCLMFILPETKGVVATDCDKELENKIARKKTRKISLPLTQLIA